MKKNKKKKQTKSLKLFKRKNKRKALSKKELVFNIVSLLLLISVGVFYEIRAYHFFNVEAEKKVLTEATLNGSILDNNKIITEGNGLYKDMDGYYFKGDVNNNYVKFGNRLFRVIRINEDGSVKAISYDLVGSFMNGNDDYTNGNIRSFLTRTSYSKNSGVYYDTIPNINHFMNNTEYSIDKIKDDKIDKGNKKYKDYITTLTIDDYVKAGAKNSYLNIGKNFYIIGNKDEDKLLTVYDDGSIQAIDSSESSGVRSVFTFKKNLKLIKGTGSIEDPYTINQDKYNNYVDGYVRLGNDTWKVYYDKDNTLKLVLNGYYMRDNVFVRTDFSRLDNEFDINNRYNIGFLLNRYFYNSLYYNGVILDGNYYNGTLSEENNYSYDSIYTNTINCKVGLLNIFDYNNTLFLDNYYMINSNDDGVVYVYRNNGILEEVSVRDERLVVPVITISKQIIRKGDGSLDDPYVV